MRITPAGESRGRARESENLAIYYTPIDDALTVTLNEKVLQRCNRPPFVRANEKQPQAPRRPKASRHRPTRPWLGSNVGLRRGFQGFSIW